MSSRRLLVSSSVLCLCMGLPQIAMADDVASATASALVPQSNKYGSLVFQPDFFASYRPNTALDMVSRIPGFSVDDGDGARGFEGTVGNVLINGARPASKNDTGSSVLGRTVAHQVERIELIRGGAPGIDMQGYAMVVNVILKANAASTEHILTHNSWLADGGHNLFGGSYQLTHRKGDYTWGLVLSDSISSSDSIGEGPYTRIAADGTILRDEDYVTDSYGGGYGIRGNFSGPVLGGKLDLTARYGISDWHNESSSSSATIRRETLSESDGTNGEIGMTYSRPLTAKLKSETRLIHQFEDFEAIDRSNVTADGVASPEQLFTANGDSSETILRSLVRYPYSSSLDFEFGGEVAYNMLQTDQSYSVGGTDIPLPSASIKVEELRGELFGKSTWRISPKLTLETGLRLENSTISQSGDVDHEESFFFAKPRAQLTWNPRENTQLRMRFERTVGQLDFGDFAASAEFSSDMVMGGNINLSPEQRWVSEVTFEQRFMKEGIISIGYRHDEIGDVIDVIPLEGGLSAIGNIGDGTLDQLKINFTIPTDRILIKGGKLSFENAWNHTEVTDPTTGRTRPISNIRPTQPVISFEQNIQSLNLNWGVDYITVMGQRSYQPDQESGWDGRSYLQLWAEYKPTPTLSIRGQLNVWESFYWTRDVYADRDTREIAYHEIRDVSPRTVFQLRLRKSF